MQVQPISHDLELNKPAPGYIRSAGLHMSAIYGALFQELEPDRFKPDSLPDPLLLEAGLALEEMLEKELKGRLTEGSGRPGEFTTEEGIIFSPDLLIFNGTTRLGEIKLTWMSSRDFPREPGDTFPPKVNKWLCQMMAYCYHLALTEARLYTFFVCGDYTRPFRPELRCWDITFSEQELQENWQLLKNFAIQKGLL